MIPKHLACTVAVLLVVAAGPVIADIGEDFEPAGIALLGSGSYSADLGNVLDPSSQYSSWTLSLEPEIDFLFLRDVALYLAPYVSYDSTQVDSSNIFRSLYYGASIGIARYFVATPKAQSGLVPALNAAIGFQIVPGIGDRIEGYQATTSSLEAYANLSLTLRLLYFLNDRIAPYVSVVPRIWYTLSSVDSLGNTVSLTINQSVYFDVGIYLGVSIWIPRSKLSLAGG